MFKPGERARFVVEVEGEAARPASLRVTVTHLASTIATFTRPVPQAEGMQTVALDWEPPESAPRGYGVEVELLNEAGRPVDTASTALDVLPAWTAYPRYGFLTDFAPGRGDIAEAVASLARYHLNGVQFYDWQYRHDHLVPPEPAYTDPLGRRLSLPVVADGVRAAHAHGMAALPYLAVYAASPEFWRGHSEWALYDAEGRPMTFGEGLLGLMNPSPGEPWIRHLLAECDSVLDAQPFDGFHVDQYGDPRTAFDSHGRPVDLPAAFAAFIAALKERHPEAAVVFNAVASWPIEALAASPQDFSYVEIWPPATGYRDLKDTIANARALSPGKPVVLALYLPADRPVNIRLADALVFSCGATRIELGEGERLLADPYFPRHQPLTDDLRSALRRYYDFAVRYGEWLGPAVPSPSLERSLPGSSTDNGPEVRVIAPEGVWCLTRPAGDWIVVCLVNMTGLGLPRWDEPQPMPSPRIDLPIEVRLPWPVGRVVWGTPDRGRPGLAPAEWTREADRLHVTLPHLDFWAIVAFQRENLSGGT
jgi:dextranase